MSSEKVPLSKQLMAEFLAMTLFVWIGCGSAVSAQALAELSTTLNNSFLIAVSTAFGYAITVLAYTIAPISGGHINPAVTLALMSARQIDIVSGCAYMLVQFLGAILGASIVWGTMNLSLRSQQTDAPTFLLGSNSVNPAETVGGAFLAEMMGTFLLVWTVMMTAVSKNSIAGNLAPIAIGFSVFLAHLVLIPITGCGINPARSFGPHFIVAVTGNASQIDSAGWWIFYTAPFVGALLAQLIAQFLFFDKDTSASSGGNGQTDDDDKPEAVEEPRN